MTERFQEAGCNKNGNLVRLETEIPAGLSRIQAGWGNFPTEKLRLLGYFIHNGNTVIKVCAVVGVSNTQKQSTNYPTKRQSVLRPQLFSYAHCSLSSFACEFSRGLLF